MNGIDLMVKEHTYIKRMLKIVRRASYKILQGAEIDFEDFNKMIDFIRNYADKHHHGKEEVILFNRMVDEIGGAAEPLVKHGMLVEHDLGRFYIRSLEEALGRVRAGDEESKLDVIANAVGYTQLLNSHIEKEDSTVYPFANRKLRKETLDIIDSECQSFEDKMKETNIQEKYLELLSVLENKYN